MFDDFAVNVLFCYAPVAAAGIDDKITRFSVFTYMKILYELNLYTPIICFIKKKLILVCILNVYKYKYIYTRVDTLRSAPMTFLSHAWLETPLRQVNCSLLYMWVYYYECICSSGRRCLDTVTVIFPTHNIRL